MRVIRRHGQEVLERIRRRADWGSDEERSSEKENVLLKKEPLHGAGRCWKGSWQGEPIALPRGARKADGVCGATRASDGARLLRDSRARQRPSSGKKGRARFDGIQKMESKTRYCTTRSRRDEGQNSQTNDDGRARW